MPWFFFFFGAIVLTRLFYWQILEGQKLVALAERQYSQNLEIPAARGEIKTSDQTPLVTNQNAYLLFAQPKEIADKEQVTQKLAPILAESESSTLSAGKLPPSLIKEKEKEIKEDLNLPNLIWVPLAHKLEEKTKEEIEKLNLAGLGFEKETKRFYPESSMAAHLLGFVGQDSQGKDKGYFGLEGYYDLEMRGWPGFLRQEKDVQGRPILLGKVKSQQKEDGRSLILHLDRTIQFIVEKNLKEALEKYGAKGGSVIVMDPQTGGILAASSFPNYDPSRYFLFDKSLYKNPLVSDSYEPGSTFKVIVMAAALNEGAVEPETRCDKCDGPRQISGYTVRTWNNKYFPQTTMTEVLEHSDNVGMVYVAEKLGLEKLLKYLGDFDIGSLSEVDLQEEESPQLRPKRDWHEIDLATAAFGQGIAVTGIQMVRAVAAIANGGKLLEPHVVAEVIDPSGKVMEIKSKVIRDVIKPSTAKVLTEMMVNAVDRGEAKWAKPKGFRIAGKTGTSQIPLAGHYDEGKTIASFVGFAPADNPRFVMLATLREPTASPWGSETAAPLWFSIAQELFAYFGITPGQ